MSEADAPVGLLLAAGAARRYGGPKLAEPLPDGTPLVRHAALAALEVCREVFVVSGGHREAVTAALAGLPVSIVDNPDWARGLGNSIACGVRAVLTHDRSASLLLMLADQPRVDAAALRRLLAAGSGDAGLILVSDHGPTRGPPCRFPARLLPELATLDGDDGARAVLRAHAAVVRTVALPEAADDIDTPADWQRIIGAPQPR